MAVTIPLSAIAERCFAVAAAVAPDIVHQSELRLPRPGIGPSTVAEADAGGGGLVSRSRIDEAIVEPACGALVVAPVWDETADAMLRRKAFASDASAQLASQKQEALSTRLGRRAPTAGAISAVFQQKTAADAPTRRPSRTQELALSNTNSLRLCTAGPTAAAAVQASAEKCLSVAAVHFPLHCGQSGRTLSSIGDLGIALQASTACEAALVIRAGAFRTDRCAAAVSQWYLVALYRVFLCWCQVVWRVSRLHRVSHRELLFTMCLCLDCWQGWVRHRLSCVRRALHVKHDLKNRRRWVLLRRWISWRVSQQHATAHRMMLLWRVWLKWVAKCKSLKNARAQCALLACSTTSWYLRHVLQWWWASARGGLLYPRLGSLRRTNASQIWAAWAELLESHRIVCILATQMGAERKIAPIQETINMWKRALDIRRMSCSLSEALRHKSDMALQAHYYERWALLAARRRAANHKSIRLFRRRRSNALRRWCSLVWARHGAIAVAVRVERSLIAKALSLWMCRIRTFCEARSVCEMAWIQQTAPILAAIVCGWHGLTHRRQRTQRSATRVINLRRIPMFLEWYRCSVIHVASRRLPAKALTQSLRLWSQRCVARRQVKKKWLLACGKSHSKYLLRSFQAWCAANANCLRRRNCQHMVHQCLRKRAASKFLQAMRFLRESYDRRRQLERRIHDQCFIRRNHDRLESWRAWVGQRRKRRAAFIVLLSSGNERRQKCVLFLWANSTRIERLRREQSVQSLHSSQNTSSVVFHFATWQAFASQRASKRALTSHVRARLLESRARLAFVTLFCLTLRAYRAKKFILQGTARHAKCHIALWHSNASASRRVRLRADAVQKRRAYIDKFMGLRTWHETVVQKLDRLGKGQRVQQLAEASLTRECFASWQLSVQTFRQQFVSATRSCHVRQKQLGLSALWCHAQECAAFKSIQSQVGFSKLEFWFHFWLTVVRQLARQRQLEEMSHKHMRSSLLGRVISEWRQRAQQAKRSAEVVECALQRWYCMIYTCTFAIWCDRTRWWKRKRFLSAELWNFRRKTHFSTWLIAVKEQKHHRNLENNLKLNVFESWVNLLYYRAIWSEPRCSLALERWHQWSIEKRRFQEVVSELQNRMRSWSKQRSFCLMARFIGRRRRSRLISKHLIVWASWKASCFFWMWRSRAKQSRSVSSKANENSRAMLLHIVARWSLYVTSMLNFEQQVFCFIGKVCRGLQQRTFEIWRAMLCMEWCHSNLSSIEQGAARLIRSSRARAGIKTWRAITKLSKKLVETSNRSKNRYIENGFRCWQKIFLAWNIKLEHVTSLTMAFSGIATRRTFGAWLQVLCVILRKRRAIEAILIRRSRRARSRSVQVWHQFALARCSKNQMAACAHLVQCRLRQASLGTGLRALTAFRIRRRQLRQLTALHVQETINAARVEGMRRWRAATTQMARYRRAAEAATFRARRKHTACVEGTRRWRTAAMQLGRYRRTAEGGTLCARQIPQRRALMQWRIRIVERSKSAHYAKQQRTAMSAHAITLSRRAMAAWRQATAVMNFRRQVFDCSQESWLVECSFEIWQAYAKRRQEKRRDHNIWSGPLAVAARHKALVRWHKFMLDRQSVTERSSHLLSRIIARTIGFWRRQTVAKKQLALTNKALTFRCASMSARSALFACQKHAKMRKQGRLIDIALNDRAAESMRTIGRISLQLWLSLSVSKQIMKHVIEQTRLRRALKSLHEGLARWFSRSSQRGRRNWLSHAAKVHRIAYLLNLKLRWWRDSLIWSRRERLFVHRVHTQLAKAAAHLCLRALSNFVVAKRHANQRVLIIRRSIFSYWCSLVDRQLHLERLCSGIVDQVNNTYQQLCFGRWCTYVEDLGLKSHEHARRCSAAAWRRATATWRLWVRRRQLHRHCYSCFEAYFDEWARTAKSSLFRNWHCYVQYRRQKAVVARVAFECSISNCRDKAMRRWRYVASCRKKQRLLTNFARQQWIERSLRFFFDLVTLHASLRKAEQHQTSASTPSSDSFTARMRQAVLRGCTAAWTLYARLSVSILQQAFVDHRSLMRRRCLHEWLERSIFARRRQLVSAKLQQYTTASRLRKVISHWHRLVAA